MHSRESTLLGVLGFTGLLAYFVARNRDSGASGDVLASGLGSATAALEDVQVTIKSLAVEWPYPRGAQYQSLFETAETKYKMPRGMLSAQAWQESRFRDDIIKGQTISSAGALGILQIVPKWHPGVDPLNVPASIEYAAAYDAALKKQFGTWALALAAYNWGPGNLSKNLNNRDAWPAETRAYVADIAARTSGVA